MCVCVCVCTCMCVCVCVCVRVQEILFILSVQTMYDHVPMAISQRGDMYPWQSANVETCTHGDQPTWRHVPMATSQCGDLPLTADSFSASSLLITCAVSGSYEMNTGLFCAPNHIKPHQTPTRRNTERYTNTRQKEYKEVHKHRSDINITAE